MQSKRPDARPSYQTCVLFLYKCLPICYLEGSGEFNNVAYALKLEDVKLFSQRLREHCGGAAVQDATFEELRGAEALDVAANE